MAKQIVSFLIIFCVALSFSFPKSLGNKVRVKPLSDEKHFQGDEEEHNLDYDHDAFLGKEEADEFDELSPEESKERLRKIVKRIDANHDGFISESEMKQWLRNIQNRYSTDELNKKWQELNLPEDGTLTWDNHVLHSYGTQETIDTNPDNSIKDMINKDKLRWEEVDLDKDGHLNREEFAYFMHPEINEKTQHVYAKETFDEIDTNKDGQVSMDEFLNDMGSGEDDDENASWVNDEKENFRNNLDKNKDGYLDLEEVTAWLMNEELEQVDSETEHLFKQADDNKDALLSEDEVVDHHDVFVGSQATEYGDILHDEF